MGPSGLGDALVVAYRELLGAEARLGETLSPRGIQVGVSVADQWPTLHEYLHLYARGLSPAGLLVLGGAPDEGSRHTGIPFTSAADARDLLGLATGTAAARSPSAAAFWRAVERAREARDKAPLESLFGTMHMAHAQPFDLEPTPEVRQAAAAHVRRLLAEARPQVVVTVGRDALAALGDAVADPRLIDLSRAAEETWSAHYAPGTPLLRYPAVDVPGPRPFRARVVPLPSLSGDAAERATASLQHVLSAAWN